MTASRRPWILPVLLVAGALSGCGGEVTGPTEAEGLRFSSTPVTGAFHNEVYSYSVTAAGGEGALEFSAVTLPGWLTFDAPARTLTGEATADNLGAFPVSLAVSDGLHTAAQSFTIQVELQRVSGGSWVGQFPHAWAHDGEPVVGDGVDLYSDASRDDVKEAMHLRAAEAFTEIKALMDLADHSLFTFPAGRSKVDIYANRLNTEYYGGFAYHGGAIVLSYDHPGYRQDQAWCRNQIEHEMFHVVETLLEGSGILGADVWFREGMADYHAGNDLIKTVADMNAWLETRRTLPGGGNPIGIHLWQDFPEEVAAVDGQGLWYPMFELAVRYLMDESGLNRSYQDVKSLFLELQGDHDRFAEAFETHMGIPLSEFEDSFFERITALLN